MGLWHTNGSLNLGPKKNNNKKKKTRKHENLQNCWLCCTGWPLSKKKESQKKNKYLDLAREFFKNEHEGDDYTNRDWCILYTNKTIK